MMGMMAKRYFTAYVWQLPVTTERARRGGVDMFGSPKFIADISFSRGQGCAGLHACEGGKNILVLKGQKVQTVRKSQSVQPTPSKMACRWWQTFM